MKKNRKRIALVVVLLVALSFTSMGIDVSRIHNNQKPIFVIKIKDDESYGLGYKYLHNSLCEAVTTYFTHFDDLDGGGPYGMNVFYYGCG